MILLQATSGILIDSQIIGAIAGAMLAALFVAVGHIYNKLSGHGERLVAVETVQEIFLTSSRLNHKETVVSSNPLTPEQQEYLDWILGDEGDAATYEELDKACQILYQEATDKTLDRASRHPYVTLLPVLDARKALKALDSYRDSMSFFQRFLYGLRA